MSVNDFNTENSVIITSKKPIDCLEWGDFMIEKWNELMRKDSKLLVLAGIHGEENGKIGKADKGLLEDYKCQIIRESSLIVNI